jgi:hypothetical protein
MFKTLRIIFTVICALFLAFIIPAGILFDFLGIGICFLGALLSFGLMLVFKQEQERKELENKPDEPSFFEPNKPDKK